jgi:hypothetical protein
VREALDRFGRGQARGCGRERTDRVVWWDGHPSMVTDGARLNQGLMSRRRKGDRPSRRRLARSVSRRLSPRCVSDAHANATTSSSAVAAAARRGRCSAASRRILRVVSASPFSLVTTPMSADRSPRPGMLTDRPCREQCGATGGRRIARCTSRRHGARTVPRGTHPQSRMSCGCRRGPVHQPRIAHRRCCD